MIDTKPLWRVMEDAFLCGRKPGFADRMGYAAELRAIAEWIKHFHLLEPDSPTYIGASVVVAELLNEADRAAP